MVRRAGLGSQEGQELSVGHFHGVETAHWWLALEGRIGPEAQEHRTTRVWEGDLDAGGEGWCRCSHCGRRAGALRERSGTERPARGRSHGRPDLSLQKGSAVSRAGSWRVL